MWSMEKMYISYPFFHKHGSNKYQLIFLHLQCKKIVKNVLIWKLIFWQKLALDLQNLKKIFFLFWFFFCINTLLWRYKIVFKNVWYLNIVKNVFFVKSAYFKKLGSCPYKFLKILIFLIEEMSIINTLLIRYQPMLWDL